MTNYHKYYNSWQKYSKLDLQIEQQFNRDLNKLAKELQIIQEQNLIVSGIQKIISFTTTQFNKVFNLIKSAPKQAINLVTLTANNASKFIKKFISDPENQRKIITGIKTLGTLALIAVAIGSPAAQAAVIDPSTGQVIGAGGDQEIANMFRGSLSTIAGALDYISLKDIDPDAARAQDQVIQLVSKINSSKVVDMTDAEKHILGISKKLLQIVSELDDKQNTNFLNKLTNIGSQFSDFIIQKMQVLSKTGPGVNSTSVDMQATGKMPVFNSTTFKDVAMPAAQNIIRNLPKG